MRSLLALAPIMLALAACSGAPRYDVIIRNGTIVDGSGAPAFAGDVAIQGQMIAAVGQLGSATAPVEVDAGGLTVAPGFINMLSHSETSLIADGRSMGELKQGVTLEVFGEGSMGPMNDRMKAEAKARQSDITFEIGWTTLGQYLEWLVARGISPNVASFVGAATVRVNEIGYADRVPTPEELDRMRAHVRTAMEEGAMGVSSALIYAPGFYAKTDELVELAKVASRHGGMYISHMRSEGNRLVEAVDELIAIAREANVRAEIYHLKAGGESNWPKLDDVIRRVEAARRAGLDITADMYTYTAGSTGLDAAMPPWVQEGGYQAWAKRLQDPATRARVAKEMVTPTDAWENLMLAAGPKGTLLVGFRNEALRGLIGKTLEEVAAARGTSAQDTAMDLVVEDGSRVQVVYFLMSEENTRWQVGLPWVSFGSDAASMATEGVFLNQSTHPRAYGNFARLLGRYVRDEQATTLEDAIRRLTSFPATTLRIRDRGLLQPGRFADVVAFDAATIRDLATYESPHQYATGMVHVWVNGTQVIKDGEHTGARPGQVVRGPGYTPK
ncbi:MAG: D-aminoacylase [Acidobacteriota bacterium]|nr:D-aminoacylase [Acidobacteriota bacterium]